MNKANVTQAHLNTIIEYMARVLEESDILYAVMGNILIIIRGHQNRSITDIDIAVQSNPQAILRALELDQR